ncbi:MAG: CHAT domain-containing protein [Thermoanaerobaculia bacterium]|nr:CHAT domain-containing protein [Thermoanaerobaculia bacterium]
MKVLAWLLVLSPSSWLLPGLSRTEATDSRQNPPLEAVQAPTFSELEAAGYERSVVEPLLRRWLDHYPDSAVGWSSREVSFVVAHLVRSDLAHYPAATAAANENARRYRRERPLRLDYTVEAYSLAARLNLRKGDNGSAAKLLSEGRDLCDQELTSEAQATSCAFLVRDEVMLFLREGSDRDADRELELAMEWLAPYPRSNAWVPILNTAADLAGWRGEIDRCLELYQRATELSETLNGSAHATTAYGYLGLGWAAAMANEWGTARAAFDRAEGIWSKELGPEHARLADVLIEYGDLLRRSGNAPASIDVLRRAVRLRESRLGKDAFDLPSALDALGRAYIEVGQLDLAEKTFRRSVAIRELNTSQDPTGHAASLSALATLARARGETDQARSLLSQRLSLLGTQLGEAQPAVAEAGLDLAELLLESDPSRAQQLAREGRSVLSRAYGEDHPTVGHAWWIEAQAQRAMGLDPTPSALAAEAIGRHHLRRIATGLSERDLLNYIEVRPHGADLALEALLAQKQPASDSSRLLAVWESVTSSRALVFETLNERRSVGDSNSPDLDRARQALAYLLVTGPEHDSATYSTRLRAARERVDREERSLSIGQVVSTHESLELPAILDRLAPDEALLAYRIFQAPTGSRLAAFIGTGTGQATVHDLGPWLAVEQALHRWHDAFLSSSEEEYRRLAAPLRRLLWDPIAPELEVSRCFIVPDGPLFLLPFATLPTTASYLVEEGPVFQYLGAERDLGRVSSPALEAGRIVVVGDPDFGPPHPTERGDHRVVPTDFVALPRARDEAKAVANHWRRWSARNVDSSVVEPLYGAQATEERWRQRAPGAMVLHLATHGFILGSGFDGLHPTAPSGPRGVPWRGVGGLAPKPFRELSLAPIAGFALANANRRSDGQSSLGGRSDGIVTLEEIRQLDLRSARLVVLSFCDSGLGETLFGEGVFGFTRAFRASGAASLVLALAPVSDRDSLEFMESFYSALLDDGQPVPEAIRRASLAQIKRRRAAGLDTHPLRWGAMVSTGSVVAVGPHREKVSSSVRDP